MSDPAIDVDATGPAPTGPVVRIDAGDVRGVWRGTSAAFLGIPFAEPPVGPLRFEAPVPVAPWEGVRDATQLGATPQRKQLAEITLIPEPSIPGDSTLNVNVYTPAPGEPAAALPVLVYIHGGGYTAGSPASPWYDGRAFNRDGVVTVSLSYRLGFDGFGYIEGAPSNRGVRDWLLALDWVQRNIAAFGGDPEQVTIAGQSAGGGAVLTLLGMPAAQHLFRAVWSLSGAVGDVTEARAKGIAQNLARLAGVEANRDGFATVPETRILELQDTATNPDDLDPMAGVTAMLADGLPWGPMIDGDLLVQPTLDSLRSGVGGDKPLVLGANDDEFTMATDSVKNKLRFVPAGIALGKLLTDKPRRKAYLAANAPQRRKGTAAVLGRFMTDSMFRAPVVRVADARAGHATWVYRFSWVSPAFGWAVHCLDVPFWFDCLDAEKVDHIAGDNPPQPLATALHAAAVDFVRQGAPGWRPWSEAPGATRVFGGDPAAPDLLPDGYASVRALA
ncbi:carboxylesterase/lipase family protein [Leifsonia naganoensis]|uniref:Carboxylic ester hydrolase n=1 Tax=Leifsonia naganoensis TaxID=150025 RepID=A0A853DWG0_9MICO|nr:carboxylesterase family protein [Leifsonia naganoensis]NYK10590.1 para-nitrobenzyl esterase [Leifsonia naganoensis]